MKRKWKTLCLLIAAILICAGLLGNVLLPWEYVLYEGEDYKITQTPFGGKMTIFNYEENFDVPSPDNVLGGAHGDDMEELVNKILSGDISWNEMYFLASAPQIEFPGMDKLYTPKLPDGIVVARLRPIWWNVDDCEFELSGNANGSVSYCAKNSCLECKYYEEWFERYTQEAKEFVRLYNKNGIKAIVHTPNRQELSEEDILTIRLWGVENGTGYHAEINLRNKYYTEDMLYQFGMERYHSDHPQVQAVRNINTARRLCIAVIVAGTALLVYTFLPKGKKNKFSETPADESDPPVERVAEPKETI